MNDRVSCQSSSVQWTQVLTIMLPKNCQPRPHDTPALVLKTHDVHFRISLLAGGWLEHMHSVKCTAQHVHEAHRLMLIHCKHLQQETTAWNTEHAAKSTNQPLPVSSTLVTMKNLNIKTCHFLHLVLLYCSVYVNKEG